MSADNDPELDEIARRLDRADRRYRWLLVWVTVLMLVLGFAIAQNRALLNRVVRDEHNGCLGRAEGRTALRQLVEFAVSPMPGSTVSAQTQQSLDKFRDELLAKIPPITCTGSSQ